MHYISYVIYYILYIDAINNRMMHPKAYRAPELLLTGVLYQSSPRHRFVPPRQPVLTSGIDVWAMGCLFVAMSAGVSPFDELNTGGCLETIRDILHRLGLPTPRQFIQWGVEGAHKTIVDQWRSLPKKCAPWEINGVHEELKPTLSQMLVYDINARLPSSSVTTSLVSGPSAATGWLREIERYTPRYIIYGVRFGPPPIYIYMCV